MLDDLLRSLGLDSYLPLFHDNEVDFDTLRILTEDDLAELGLPFGPRKKLMHALSTPGAPAHPSAPPPPTLPAAGLEAEAVAAPAPVPTPAGDAMDGERRQLTVLFCDMVGFTELATRIDPEVLRGIMRDYEDVCAVCIARYEGYVFLRLGDGIVAFFGYPLAHED
jgi:hypothetical protein